MAENLNYKTENSYCYRDSAIYCVKYGRLYTWAAAVGNTEEECGFGKICNLGAGIVRGVCPEGWHLPSYAEWHILFTAVGASAVGEKLRTTSGWIKFGNGEDGNGSDAFGFSVLPTGSRNSSGFFIGVCRDAGFWSLSEDDYIYSAHCMRLNDYDGKVSMYDCDKRNGLAVRCLKD